MRQNYTNLKHRSFSMDRRSAISILQNVSSPTKSFVSKSSKHVKLNRETNKFDLTGSSVPIEIYFNPQIRKQYVSKVIDDFFAESQIPATPQNPQKRLSQISPKRESLRNRLVGWKRKSKPAPDVDITDSSKFIRSSPKKSVISDLSEQNSFSLIKEDIEIPEMQKSQVQLSKSIIDNIQSITLKKSRVFRPLSEYKKKSQNLFFDDIKSINSDPYFSFFNLPVSPHEKKKKQIKVATQANQYFEEFNVLQNGIFESKIRKYLGQNNPLLIRQEKLSKRLTKMLWKHSKFPSTLEYPTLKSIKDQISQQFKYGTDDNDAYIEIYPKPYYNQLFPNRNEQLRDIITSMTKFIINNKGRVLTGAFQVSNLYKVNQKQFLLKDLGLSAIVQNIKIRDKNLVYLYPYLFKDQEQTGKWFIRPEYLAPQVLDSIANNEIEWISEKPQAVVAAQIWSLGCMLLQMLTLIPLNSDIRCRVKSNPQNLRRGFLSIKFNERRVDIETLQRKQKGLELVLIKNLENELINVPVQKRVLTVVQKMLLYEPQRRIKPSKILQDLKY